jgi:hypothetical protein
MEALGGEREYSSYSFTTSALDGGEWSASRPGRALPPVPIGQEAGWAQEPVWTLRIEEKSFAPVVLKYVPLITYSGVLFTMELYCTPKFNTQLLITISSTTNTMGASSLLISQNTTNSSSIEVSLDNKTRYYGNYCLFTLLHDNGTKAVEYCCVAKETQHCTSELLCSRAPTSRCYGNHNTQQ